MSKVIVAELDCAELAIRMCEASYGLKRPTPSALDAPRAMDPDCRAGWMRAAAVALEYFRERVEAGGTQGNA